MGRRATVPLVESHEHIADTLRRNGLDVTACARGSRRAARPIWRVRRRRRHPHAPLVERGSELRAPSPDAAVRLPRLAVQHRAWQNGEVVSSQARDAREALRAARVSRVRGNDPPARRPCLLRGVRPRIGSGRSCRGAVWRASPRPTLSSEAAAAQNDFCDWAAIDAWAVGIARALGRTGVRQRSTGAGH